MKKKIISEVKKVNWVELVLAVVSAIISALTVQSCAAA
jgi:hypothetical protein